MTPDRTMKAAFVTKYGGPEVLEIRETPIPKPAPDQILVRVRAFGLNFADVMGRFGVYPGTPRPPFILGLEFSGEVAGIGENVTHFKGGERVMGYSRHGSHAQYVCVNEKLAVELPAKMEFEEGAAFLVMYLTAYHGIVRLANIRKGEKLLVHAASGGAGIATLQLGKHLGAEIFGTAGTEDKIKLALKNGADHVINYNTTDFAGEIKRITNNYGVDVVMDSVGGLVYDKSWDLLAPMGRYVLYGLAAIASQGALNKLKAATIISVMKPIFPVQLMSANKSIFGFNLGTLKGKESYFREAVIEMLRLYDGGVLKPLIGRTFRFNEIVEAHRALQTRQTVGKVVVHVDTE
ncbi:MAG: zinc-binding dehydrogenase [Ignavibacteriae bacterium]|nr:zinc-binding dehydrogenase [Ignavibacteriota bacterium]